MDNNFNPGFDREKLAFLELANSRGGLDPIEYIYAGDASFESVLASYVKGGMFDINMLYVTNIDANDIITVTLEADIATITTIDADNINANTIDVTTLNSDYIYNKYLIDTHDLTAHNQLLVGSLAIPGEAVFHTNLFEVASAAISLDTAYCTLIAGGCSITTPLLTVNSAAFEVNYVAGALPISGIVGIYSGGLIDINAPIIKIGDPTKLGINTQTILMKPQLNFTLDTPEVGIGATNINIGGVLGVIGSELQSCKITARDFSVNNPLYVATEPLFRVSNQGIGNVFAEFKGLVNFNIIEGTNVNIDVFQTHIRGQGFLVDTTTDIELKTIGTMDIISTSGVIKLSSPTTLEPVTIHIPGLGVAVAGAIPVVGNAQFIIPNVLMCTDGVISTVNFTVDIIFG